MSNQCERILEHIVKHGSISALDGMRMNPPIMRVASRIADLRAEGYQIVTESEPTTTGGRYAVYKLTEKDARRMHICENCGAVYDVRRAISYEEDLNEEDLTDRSIIDDRAMWYIAHYHQCPVCDNEVLDGITAYTDPEGCDDDYDYDIDEENRRMYSDYVNEAVSNLNRENRLHL